MNFLLDTHILLWWLDDYPALSETARQVIRDPQKVIFVSAVTVWEIAIKKSIGKLRAPDGLEEAAASYRFAPLPITFSHAQAAGALPAHHKDPFDRMLVAQAKLEGLTLLTHDRRLKSYGSFVRVV